MAGEDAIGLGVAVIEVHTQEFHPSAGVLPRPLSSRLSISTAGDAKARAGKARSIPLYMLGVQRGCIPGQAIIQMGSALIKYDALHAASKKINTRHRAGYPSRKESIPAIYQNLKNVQGSTRSYQRCEGPRSQKVSSSIDVVGVKGHTAGSFVYTMQLEPAFI